MNNITMLILHISLFVLIASANASGEKMSMIMQQSGFHRNIRYVTYFLQPWNPEPCDFCIQQTIPAGAYVDMDQLDELVRFDKINYFSKEKVNIEAMASKSRPFQVHLYGDTASLYTIDLPIHFRYHSPGTKNFEKVNIDAPRLFVKCSDELMTSEHFPVNGSSTFQMRCRESSQMCKWQEVDYEMHSDPISVSIPIGSAILEPVVTACTICISWIACYFIVKIMYRKSIELKSRI